eukprot:134147-Hanusia_phi.AAC.1
MTAGGKRNDSEDSAKNFAEDQVNEICGAILADYQDILASASPKKLDCLRANTPSTVEQDKSALLGTGV